MAPRPHLSRYWVHLAQDKPLARARAVTLMNYPDIARHVGLDPHAMMGRARLHPGALADPENWIPAKRVLTLLEDSARHSGRDDFGVLLGGCRTFASLGPVSLLLKHESNLRSVIGAMIDYRRLLNDLLHLTLRENGSSVLLEWNLIPGLRSSQGVNLLAATAYRVLVDGGGIDWRPECLHFRQASPECLATFKQLFRCDIEFESNVDGMSFSSRCLDLANEFADPVLAAHARRLLDLVPGIWRNDTMQDRVKSTLPFLISNGQTGAQNVADSFGVSVRTLQRQLIGEGRSYRSLLNDVRRDLAVRYLGDSSLSITVISQLTGYASLSSFTRWFVLAFAMSPARWRRTMAQRDAIHFHD